MDERLVHSFKHQAVASSRAPARRPLAAGFLRAAAGASDLHVSFRIRASTLRWGSQSTCPLNPIPSRRFPSEFRRGPPGPERLGDPHDHDHLPQHLA